MGHSYIEITQTIRDYLSRKAVTRGMTDVEITDSLNFIDEGLIDSLEFIELITLVEESHGLQVDLSPYEPDVFYTIAGFATCISAPPEVAEESRSLSDGALHYRSLEREDPLWPEIRRLLGEQYRVLHDQFDSRALSGEDDVERAFGFMHSATGRTDCVIAAITNQSKPVGFIWGTLRVARASAERAKRAQWIECYVRDEQRGKGVARELYRLLEDWFRANGVKIVEADVNVNNARSRAYMQACGLTDYMVRMHKHLDEKE